MSQAVDHDPAAPSTIEIGLEIPSSALLDQTLDFYVDGIGFRDLGHIDIDRQHLGLEPVKIHAIRFGISTLKLKYDSRTDRPDATRATTPNSSFYVSLRVKDIERTIAKLERLEPKPLMIIAPGEASTLQGGTVKYAFFLDPVGTRVELVQGRPWVGTENDNDDN